MTFGGDIACLFVAREGIHKVFGGELKYIFRKTTKKHVNIVLVYKFALTLLLTDRTILVREWDPLF